MKIFFPILASVFVLLGGSLFAQPENPDTSASDVESPLSISDSPNVLRGLPVPLFDGQSLDGWCRKDGEPSQNWRVVDGTLYRASGGGDLYHRNWFRDFELSFEWRIEKGGNSGVKYRVQPYGKQMLGCEYQIQDDAGQPGTVHSTGSIYAVVEPSKNKVQNPLDQWNRSRIVVCGNDVEHWLNDQRIVSTRIGQLDWLQRVGKSKFHDKEFFGQNREGRIFLQDHGNPVWFRNIMLVPLDADICR